MPNLRFPTSSTPGRLPQEGDGILMNAFVERRGEEVSWRRVPGLKLYAAVGGASGCRGLIDVNGVVHSVSGPYVYRSTEGSPVYTGAIPDGRLVTLAQNKRIPPDIVLVLQEGGAFVIRPPVSDPTGGSPLQVDPYPTTQRDPIDPAVPANGLPANVNSVVEMDGFFIFTVPDGRMFSSNLNTLDVPALNFATAENRPDGLLRGIVHGGIFYAMGPASIEPWLNVGKDFFPLTRGTSVLQVGLLTAAAVAGFEAGWTNNPLFVTPERTVHELEGYQTKAVSTPPVEEFLRASDAATVEAMVYAHGGHSIWAVSSNLGTWCYDVTTKAWHQRQTGTLPRWRGQKSTKSGERWIIGDTLSSTLFSLDETVTLDYDGVPTWTVESSPLKGFPMRSAVPGVLADFTMARGQGQILVSWSLDGGLSWIGPYPRSIAAKAGPVRVNRLGLSTHHGLRVRLACTDNVDFALFGAHVPDPDARRP